MLFLEIPSSAMEHETEQMTLKKTGFTLVEMLLVVAIISILIALLLPSLGKARASAFIVTCAANQGQIGQAQAAYLFDNQWRFPQLANWSGLIGKRGASGYYSSSSMDVTSRPLNNYVSEDRDGAEVAITECPSDLGDSFPSYNGSIKNCYREYGTSYLPQWNSSVFRTALVYGVPGGTKSIGYRSISQTKNKMILADWSWHGNRPTSDPMTRWHNNAFVRQFNTLMADWHVEFLDYPVEDIDYAYTGNYHPAPPDPSYIWW